jgi:hypothetical protein
MVGIGSFELDVGSKAITSSDGFRRLVGMAADKQLDLAGYMRQVHAEDRALVEHAIWDTVASRAPRESSIGSCNPLESCARSQFKARSSATTKASRCSCAALRWT